MARTVHPLAGTRPDASTLVTRQKMAAAYYAKFDQLNPIKNGTSGHRGLTGIGFSDLHVASMTQALCDIKKERGTWGPELNPEIMAALGKRPFRPVIMGKDVRFTSDLAQMTAVEVFAANGYTVLINKDDRSTPTPVVSHTILTRNFMTECAEGVVITASHNPPEEAGYKSNGLDGGPNTRTKEIDERANYYMQNASAIKKMDYEEAMARRLVVSIDMVTPYVEDLGNVVRMDIIKGGRFGAAPLGGSANGYYEAVNAIHGTNIEVILPEADPSSANRTYDWDGKLRGDPSSKHVMMAIQGMREKLGVPFVGANDNDADRFGGEDAKEGILDPNHVLCVLFDYLAKERGFNPNMGVGRTIGTTHMIDLIAAGHNRFSKETFVGFKYHVDDLYNGRDVLAGEESAGLSFPRLNGGLWVTEKDGIAAVLLMMEVIAKTGKDIGTLYGELVAKYGPHQYERIDMPATAAKKKKLGELAADPASVKALIEGKKIAGRNIERTVIGDGVKVVLEGGVWVLKRASGTEDIIKDYREERGDSFATVRKASEEIDSLLGLEGL